MTGIAVAFSLVLAPFPAQPARAQTAMSEAELQAQIQNLLTTIAALQTQLAALGQSSGAAFKPNVPDTFRFIRNLRQGMSGTDVLYLQRILNAYPGSRLRAAGIGSPGFETTYFGALTKSGVIRFQEMFASEILAPFGLTNGTGFVGVTTRAKLNQLIAAGFPTTTPPPTTPPPTTPPPTSGTGTLLVAAATQPTATLAPESASRLPFARFTVTAGTNAAVTLTGVTVERTGLGSNAVFDSVVLLDDSGQQVGAARTLSSLNRATVGDSVTIPAGASRTFTVAGNMAANLDAYAGQTVGLSVTGVTTANGTVTGSFPIAGPLHTVNATLQIGAATVRVGTLGTTAATREIGTDDQNFASFIITAGSQEDVRLMSVRWNQSGSAGVSDIANLEAVVGGTVYPVSVSADGRYYTATFGSGILISKGQSTEVVLRGDIDRGSGRTISFDIERASDIHLVGTQTGYGVTPTAATTASVSTGAEFTTGTPFFSGSVTTISGASLTVSRAASSVQTAAVGVANQSLGAFTIESSGEGVTIQNLTFDIAITRSSGSTAAVEDIDSLTLVNANGTVVAGPVDATGSGTTGTVSFSGSVTIPEGQTTLFLRGQLGSDFRLDDQITVSLEPSADLTNIRGGTSGNTVTASPTGTVTGNTVTVRSTTVTVNVASSPSSQTVVAGAQNFAFSRLQFDVTGSGEDVRLSTIPVQLTYTGDADNLNNCRAFNVTGGASTQLSSGGNVVNPSTGFTSGNTLTFTLDSSIVLPRGQVSTIEIRCDVSTSASNGQTFRLGISTAPTVVGVQSGSVTTANVVANAGPTMTVGTSGSFTVSTSPSSPAYSIAAAGDNKIVAVYRFTGSNETINLSQIGLQLSGAATTSSPADVTSVTLWDGSTQVGTAVFTGSNRYATTTLSSSFVIPAFGSKDLTVRANFGQIGPSQSGTEGAFVKIDYDGDNASATRGTGASSGTIITSGTSADTSTEGVRVFNTIPTVASASLPNTILVNGTQALMRFSISADDSDAVSIGKLTLSFSTSSATVSDVNVYAFSDSAFSSPASGAGVSGRLDANDQTPGSGGVVEVYAENTSGTQTPFQIPAAGTVYFEVRGTVTGSASGSAVTARLEGDSAAPVLTTAMGTFAQIEADANDDFIWSPNETGTSAIADDDWTNGYGVPGLPAFGLSQTIAR